MDQRPPLSLLAYETWEAGDGYHARYTGHLSQLATEHGCVAELVDRNIAELMRQAIGNRVRAWAYERWRPRFDSAEALAAGMAARHQQ